MVNGKLLQAIINENQLNQKEVANLASLNAGTLSNIVKGHTKPSYRVINQLRTVLALSDKDMMRIFFTDKED